MPAECTSLAAEMSMQKTVVLPLKEFYILLKKIIINKYNTVKRQNSIYAKKC